MRNIPVFVAFGYLALDKAWPDPVPAHIYPPRTFSLSQIVLDDTGRGLGDSHERFPVRRRKEIGGPGGSQHNHPGRI